MHVGIPVTSILWDVPHSVCHRKPDEIGDAVSTVSCKTRPQTSLSREIPIYPREAGQRTNEVF